MVAVSNVPGRLRLQNPILLGRPVLCRQVESAVLKLSGVWRPQASHRTGTLLLVHDGQASESLIEDVRRALDTCCRMPISERDLSTPVVMARDPLREAAKELAWHGLRIMLPQPWAMLLPVAQRLMAGRNGGNGNERA